MKKTFTILIAAIAAILMMVLPGKVVGQTYEELYSANFTSLSAFSYTQNKEFTLSNKTWIASTCQVSSNVFYLGCSNSTVAYGVLNNNTSFSNEVAALKSADSKYSSDNNYTTAHAYAMRFDNSYSNVTKVEFTWSGGNNAFQVYLFGDSGSGYVKLASTNYASSGATTSGSVTWTGDATNFTKFAIVARPGTTSTIVTTNKTLRAATFKIYKTQASSVTAPTINPTAVNSFEDELEVSLNVAQGTTAYYNINNNTDPTSESTPYTAPFNISASSTIKAIAYDGNLNPSSVVTKTYTKEEFSNIKDVDTDDSYKVRGTVVATNTRGFMLADNTGYVYVYLYHRTYNTNPTIPNINDKRKVNGTPGTYGKVIEYKYGCTVTEATGTTFTGDTPAVIDGDDMYDVTQSSYVFLSAYEQFEGELSESSGTYTISVAGDEHRATAQISYPNSTQTDALDALVGKTVRVQGYFTGLSNGNYTVMLGSVEEVTNTDPSIFIANASLQLGYPANQNGSFAVEYTNFEPAAATAVLYTDENCNDPFPTSGDGAWITLNLNNNYLAEPYTSIPFTVSANTGNDPRTVYIKVEAMDAELEVVDAVFQINQAKQPQFTITYAAGGGTGTMTDNNLYHQGDIVTLKANTFTAPADKIWGSWSAKDSENNDVTISNGQITMPASNVTVTAQWINDPNAPTYAWVETSLASLTSNDIFVIVGTRTDDSYGGSYALPNNNGTSNPSAESITITDNKLKSSPANEYKWNISGNATDGYTFYPNGDDKNWLYCTNANQGVRVGTGDNKLFKFKDGGTVGGVQQAYYIYNTGQSRYVGLYNAQDWRCYTSINDNIKNQSFTFYKRVLAKEITGIDNSGGYYLISSPLAASLTPSIANGFLRDDGETDYYDLYYFDQAKDKEWKNYKQNTFSIASGKGYLYANKSNTTLLFDGAAYNGDGNVTLSFTSDAEFEGWNLIGNPFPSKAYLADNRPFYRMNAGGTEIILSDNNLITPMEGIFVHAADADDNSVTFTTTAPSKRSSNSRIVLNIIGSNDNVIDRAIVRLDEGSSLEKLMINNNNTKIYIPQDNAQFALAVSNAKGSMPVNFKAAEMGKYTISVNTEGIDMDYLHLIDRLTGEDVNLLLDNSYSFIASAQDVESRFILSFTATGYNTDADEPFAYLNGSEIIVSGEGELQIFDVTGRQIMTTTINGIESVNVSAQGVLILRLVGSEIKTQKIVVR